MALPIVFCMCLTADRQALTDRAVWSFLRQTRLACYLFILDTGVEPYIVPKLDAADYRKIIITRESSYRGKRVGALRNIAADMNSRADIIAHWDSDDWSHPERLTLQFEDMATTAATGFSNMLFFDSRPERRQAWEYTYADRRRVLGASLMYWRSEWKACPFDESKIEGEERWWPYGTGAHGTNGLEPEPLLIADYHGANTSRYGAGANGVPVIFDQTPAQRAHNPQFRRAPEWDQHCRERMAL
jgi:hypothetical protein